MKTIFTRIIRADVALDIANHIIETAGQHSVLARKYCSPCQYGDHQCWSCPNRLASSTIDKGIVYCPDNMSGKNSITFPKQDTMVLVGEAISGEHTLEINVATGRMVATHEGRRNSYPGNALHLLPEIWKKEIGIANKWTLVEYKSSEPNWAAVAGFLYGKAHGHEDLPMNQYEKTEVEKIQPLKEAFKLLGKPWPNDLYVENGSLFIGGHEEFKPKFSGLEYRRLYAQGCRV